MKKSIILLITFSLLYAVPSFSQGGLLKKVTSAMKDELLGTGSSKNQAPEPSCACDAPEVILDMGKSQLEYSESTICSKDDGSLLFQNRITGDYYVSKGGVSQGPFRAGDPQIAGYSCDDSGGQKSEDLLIRYKEYISKSGDKYVIKFGGKSYGPYAQLSSFVVTKSKDKFAAVVIENIFVTEDEGKKMDAAINKAKTDQEKMELAMQYSQQMTQKMLEGGGPATMTPILVTNVPDVMSDFTIMSGTLSSNSKYDDIVLLSYGKATDLQGKTLIALKPSDAGASNIFINSANTKYVLYNYGSLTFSDGKVLTDLMNPLLVKSGNQVYIAYMYYSPKKNAIVQCKIPF
jgi:hypothetical protein